MPGMNLKNLNLTNPFVVQLFRHATFVTMLLWMGAIGTIVLLVATLSGRAFSSADEGVEGSGHRRLRVLVGALWLLDGVLQFQPAMPLGLASVVIGSQRAGTPSWLSGLMTHGINLWNAHPVTLAAGVAWLQVGL